MLQAVLFPLVKKKLFCFSSKSDKTCLYRRYLYPFLPQYWTLSLEIWLRFLPLWRLGGKGAIPLIFPGKACQCGNVWCVLCLSVSSEGQTPSLMCDDVPPLPGYPLHPTNSFFRENCNDFSCSATHLMSCHYQVVRKTRVGAFLFLFFIFPKSSWLIYPHLVILWWFHGLRSL